MLYFSQSSGYLPIIYANIFPLNWVDLIIGLTITSLIIKGKKKDFFQESFGFFVIIVATFIAVHYYERLGSLFVDFHSAFVGVGLMIAFALLIITVLVIFSLVEDSWLQLVRFQLDKTISHWMGTILTILKSVLVGGLIFLALMISSLSFVVQSARDSLSYYFFNNISAGVYKTIYSGLIKPISNDEPFNEDVFNRMAEMKKL